MYFHFNQNEVLISTENKILLFSIFGLFGKIFSLKIKTKIQPNTFLSLFSISIENKNKKTIQPNTPYILSHQNPSKIYAKNSAKEKKNPRRYKSIIYILINLTIPDTRVKK